jgi:tetratricopeptide (TPR) repeat protein
MTEEQRMQRELRPVRARHDDPELPDDVSDKDLDRIARNELKTLTKDNAEWVAKHLAMAARLIESDPQQAHAHVISAARRAGRIAVVRESLAITAYAVGDFALALRELRTYRRISGSNDQLALMVDSERGVGRPDRALELGRSVDRNTLPPAVQVSLAIAMSGARLDLGETDAALVELEIPQLDPKTAFSYSPELFSAYADVLEELGRTDEAETWHERAARADAALGNTEDDDETIEIEEEYSDEDDADEVSTSSTTEPVIEPVEIDAAEEDEVSTSSTTEPVIEPVEIDAPEEDGVSTSLTTDDGVSTSSTTDDGVSTSSTTEVDDTDAKAEAARLAKNAKARAARAAKNAADAAS